MSTPSRRRYALFIDGPGKGETIQTGGRRVEFRIGPGADQRAYNVFRVTTLGHVIYVATQAATPEEISPAAVFEAMISNQARQASRPLDPGEQG